MGVKAFIKVRAYIGGDCIYIYSFLATTYIHKGVCAQLCACIH